MCLLFLLTRYLRGNSIPFMRGRGGDGDNNNTHGNGEGMGTACRKRCGNGVGMGTKTHCAGQSWGQKSVPVSFSTFQAIDCTGTDKLTYSNQEKYI